MLDTAADETPCTEADLGRQWIECMRRGDFSGAWNISDLQLRRHAGISCNHLPRHFQYVWNGTPLAGRRVLIRCYHGLGDTIQFVRCMPMVEAVAAQSFLWVQAPLIPLIRTMRLRSVLLPLADREPDVDYDVHAELMELPYIFRTTLDTIPAGVPYFRVDPPVRHRCGTHVGLVWASGRWDARRNVPYPEIARLLELRDVTFYILQRGSAQNEVEAARHIVFAGSDDPFAAAQMIKSLDLVISVDSMPAHLAGALAVPVWTLLPSEADWRWMRSRTDCPWYPTMRLFRQKKPDNWHSVIGEVRDALASLHEGNPARMSC